MARLIPSFMDEVTPPGERDVFNLLTAGPDHWTALHSLDLAPWNRGLRTEIDFVVIIPDLGLLCIEVKSHENIYFDGQRWHPDSIGRSPFKQACDGRYTLHRRLAEIAPQFRHVPVAHCCIFPRSTFDLTRNLSVQTWELMDSRRFRAFVNGNSFCSELKTRMKQAVEADASVTPLTRLLSANQIESLIALCVPIQRRHPDKREEAKRREEQLADILRLQQKPVLQLAELNKRLVVRGAAGTGKTLIAMQVARRISESGRRVALLCFNQLVGDWMVRTIVKPGPLLPNIVVGRAIRVLAEMTDVQVPPDPPQRFWDRQLPEMLEERLTDPDFKAAAQFDYLVLDDDQPPSSGPGGMLV